MVLPVVLPDGRGCARTTPGLITAKRIRVASATEILCFTENLMSCFENRSEDLNVERFHTEHRRVLAYNLNGCEKSEQGCVYGKGGLWSWVLGLWIFVLSFGSW